MPKLLLGDSLERLKELDANSVDAVVTDPPYGLAFMNKHWDYDVPSVELWREVLRVLKPGGHLLSFGGTRTYHRMVVAIEDAGFEIRDQVQWIYGSGFPKSMDVSKAIDKQAGAKREVIGKNPNARPNCQGKRMDTMGGEMHWSPLTAPATPDAKRWQGWGTALKPANEPIVLARKPLAEKTVAKNVIKYGTGALNIDASRIGPKDATKSVWVSEDEQSSLHANHVDESAKLDAPETKACTAISGVEPILSAKESAPHGDISRTDTGCFAGRSPEALATNQTGDFNSSIAQSGKSTTAQSRKGKSSTTKTTTHSTIESKTSSLCPVLSTQDTISLSTPHAKSETPNTQSGLAPSGRWPSNLILDESAAAALDEQSGVSTEGNGKVGGGKNIGSAINMGGGIASTRYPGTGGASRFFYVAKASKRERNAGLEGMPERSTQHIKEFPSGGIEAGKGAEERGVKATANFHPTVKPVKLMEYLVRMITPPGGIVLDPFMGSGTTGCAAVKLGFQFIGCEMSEEYLEIARKRIEHAQKQAPEQEELPLEASNA